MSKRGRKKLLDSEARDLLRTWPSSPKDLWSAPDGTSHWLRAWPRAPESKIPGPMLGAPRVSRYRTRPDGLWLNLGRRGLVDAFCVECCGTIQNLNDKRARYVVVGSSLVVNCPKAWLSEDMRLQGGRVMSRWEVLGLQRAPSVSWNLPVRFLRVLYAIPDEHYDRWAVSNVPAPFEFFCRHSSLGSYASQKMQKFLRSMSPEHQFYTRPINYLDVG